MELKYNGLYFIEDDGNDGDNWWYLYNGYYKLSIERKVFACFCSIVLCYFYLYYLYFTNGKTFNKCYKQDLNITSSGSSYLVFNWSAMEPIYISEIK